MVDKVIVLVMDSVGVGALPDAGEYGDEGSNTFLHVASSRCPLKVPNLQELGIGNILELPEIPPAGSPKGAFGKMAEASKGKDTTTGHWEMMGVILEKALPTYPNGFPIDLITRFEELIGREIIGNKVASGTEIIAELGEEHVATGKPIVYTSADSVFQVAAHESVVPVEDLYSICRTARELLTGEHSVARVIARPFTGALGEFKRTGNRRDFSLEPTGPTVMDALKSHGRKVLGIGKIEDIFAGRGLTDINHTKENRGSLEATIDAARQSKDFIFTNCVDFDMLYGHRNDVDGYARALEELDTYLPLIIEAMGPEGILFITADHGCDPTTASTDHSREYVPLLVVGKPVKPGVSLGIRSTFCDLGATVCELLGVPWKGAGTSFVKEILI